MRLYEARPYQAHARDGFLALLERGGRRGIAVLPTGTGKTPMTLDIAREAHARELVTGRTLYLAHRGELLYQPMRDTLPWVWPEVRPGLVKAEHNDCRAPLVFATVQTLYRPGRLEAIVKHGQIGLVIYDEAHHAGSEKNLELLIRLGVFESDGPALLGCTATVEPLDETGIFEATIGSLQALEAIGDSWLVPPAWRRIRLPGLDLRGLSRKGKGALRDFGDRRLGERLLAAGIVGAVAETVAELAGRRALIFCATVEQSQITAEELRSRGVRAVHLDGTTPERERATIYRQLERGEIDALTNCAVLTEGFNETSLDAIVMARPCLSKVLYLQCIGRGLRTHPGKEDCLVVDFSGASDEYGLAQLPTILGLDAGTLEANGFDEAVREAEETGTLEREYGITAEKIRARALQVKAVSWVHIRRDFVGLSLGKHGILTMQRTPIGCYLTHEEPNKAPRVLIGPVAVDVASGVAEDMARRAGALKLFDKAAEWRSKLPTKSQRGKLRAWGLWREGLTRGEASDLMDAQLLRWRFNRAIGSSA